MTEIVLTFLIPAMITAWAAAVLTRRRRRRYCTEAAAPATAARTARHDARATRTWDPSGAGSRHRYGRRD